MKTKVCTKCGIEKPISEFSKEKRTKIGLQSQCKKCMYLTSINWKKKNPDKISESNKRAYNKLRDNPDYKNKKHIYLTIYYKKNKEKIDVVNKKWRENNRERVIVIKGKYYIENREYFIKKADEWKRANPNKVKKWTRERQAICRKELEDAYVISKIKRSTKIGWFEIKQHSEWIKQKREQLLLYRQLKVFKLKLKNHETS